MKNTKLTRLPFGLEKLTGGPIDWDAWAREAAQPRGTYKGKKFGPEIRAKFSAAQKKRFAAKRALLAEALKNAAPPPPPPYDPFAYVTVTDRLLGSMQPGSWYSTRDMAEVAGVKYQACKAFAVTWWRKTGLLVRILNPAWKPPERVGGRQEPKWLYGLSEEGKKRHRLSAALL